MRSEPEPDGDAYRTLGLEPGASMAEVKRAYRLLAKAFHPDSAGEAALPRFLAIHEAYDQLTSGRIVGGAKSARAAPAARAEPWRADPARARAARERARTGRGGPSKTGASSPSAPGGASTASGTGSGSAPGSASNGARGTTGTRGTGRRHVRKATMGSTSYDEARDHNDATWSGASWYGPSSGEYWIVNPREYADPRKHGPEYQSRARRPLPGDPVGASQEGPIAATATGTGTGPGPGSGTGPGTAERPGSTWASTAAGAEREERPRRWGAGASASSWTAPFDAPDVEAPRREGPSREARRARASTITKEVPGESAPSPLDAEAPGATGSSWLGGPAADPIRRLGMALVAWPPIGLAAAVVIGDITGCATYPAACGGTEPLLPWLAQAGILGLLLLLPPLTRILAGGAVAVLLALIPLTLVLVAVGGTGAPQGQATLAVVLATAWVGGVGWSVVAFRRRRVARPAP